MSPKKPSQDKRHDGSGQQRRDAEAHGRSAGAPVTVAKGEEAWRRALLDRNAPSAEPVRRLLNRLALELEEHYEYQLRTELPKLAYDEFGVGPEDDVDPSSAWSALEELHDYVVAKAQRFVAKRGSAEWLWFLRRLRGQFHINSLDTTDPYVQLVAEALATGVARPASPLPDQPRFVFAVEAETLLDLMWLRHAAIQLYRLHATMRRCAKGQSVRFLETDVPYAVPDELIESAIDEFDRRSHKASVNLLDAVGLHVSPRLDEVPTLGDTFGGIVPSWHLLASERPRGRREVLDPNGPAPAMVVFIDLNSMPPFATTGSLRAEHVALIALLWAGWNIATRERERMKARMTAAIQWGYMVTPTTNYLLVALDEAIDWMREHSATVIPAERIPQDGAAVLGQLSELKPSLFPPLPGNPVHQADDFSVIDLVGASHRLFETLVRPIEGAGVNFWSAQFEVDVQAIIDASLWAPSGHERDLIGRVIRRADGTVVTDVDALAVRGHDVVLVSCKSVAHTPQLSSGRPRAIRDRRIKLERAAAKWDEKLRELRENPRILSHWKNRDIRLHGVVVAPSIPFVVDERWRRPRPPFGTPAVISSEELEHALRSHR